MNDLIYVFALIGAVFIVCVFISAIYIIIVSISEIIKKYKIRYQYKHRFNKPPKAKCYCKDCKHRNEYEECFIRGGYLNVADDCFVGEQNQKNKGV